MRVPAPKPPRNPPKPARRNPTRQLKALAFNEFLPWLDADVPVPLPGRTLSSVDADAIAESFTGTKDWPEAQALASSGWPDGTARAMANIERMREHLPEMSRPAPGWSETGIYFDVARVLEGEPEAWASLNPKPDRPTRILINLMCSAYVSTEELERRGAALVALVALCQEKGLSIELWAGISITGSPGAECICQFQQAGTPVSVDTLAYWIGHPSSLRRQFFRAIEKMSPADTPAAGGNGYGYPADFTLALEQAGPWDCVVQFSNGNDAWRNDESACEWVLRQLAQITASATPWETTHDA